MDLNAIQMLKAVSLFATGSRFATTTRVQAMGEPVARLDRHSDSSFELQALVSDFEQAEMRGLRVELNLPLLALSLVENGAVLQSDADHPPIGYLTVKNELLLFDPAFNNPPKTIEELQAHHLACWIRGAARATHRDDAHRM